MAIMKLVDIENKKVVPNNELLIIPCVKSLYDNCKGEDFYKHFSYAVMTTDWNSPYKAYDKSIREEVILEDVYGDRNYKIPSFTENFTKEWYKFNATPATRLLDAAEEGIEALIAEYMNLSSKIGQVDKLGKPLVNIGDLTKWIKELKGAIESINAAREMVVSAKSTGKVETRKGRPERMYDFVR